MQNDCNINLNLTRKMILILNFKNLETCFEHVGNVKIKFRMKIMLDYHYMYVKVDALLLAYVFETFVFEKNPCICLNHFLLII